MSVANLERRIDWPQDLVDSSITDRFDWLIAYGEITVWRRCSAVSYNKRWRGEKERQQRRDLNQSKEVCTRLWHSLIPTYTFTFELKFIRHTVLHTSFRVLIYHFYVFTIFCFFFWFYGIRTARVSLASCKVPTSLFPSSIALLLSLRCCVSLECPFTLLTDRHRQRAVLLLRSLWRQLT